MDLFGKFRKLDSSLQRGLDNGFARVFGGEVIPAEIDELLKDQTENSVMMDPSGNHWAPCFFIIHLSRRDHSSLLSKHPHIEEDFSDRMQRFIRNSGWKTNAPVHVELQPEATLHTGQLKVSSQFNIPPASHTSSSDHQPQDAGSTAEHPGTNHSATEHPGTNLPASENHASPLPGANPAPPSGFSPPTPGTPSPHTTAQGEVQAPLSGVVHEAPGTHTLQPHPGEAAYASGESPEKPVSYPGTEVMAHPAHKEDPVTGQSLQGSPQHTEVTLILRDGSDRRYSLRKGANRIGRGNGVDLRIPDTGVSRQHAEINWDGYDAVLTDLNSTNGTTVNETPIDNWLLADGDIIVLGHSEIEVRFT